MSGSKHRTRDREGHRRREAGGQGIHALGQPACALRGPGAALRREVLHRSDPTKGRMHKITPGHFPELSLDAARGEGAVVLARLWGGEDVTTPRKKMAPRFRDFAKCYRERRHHRWKPSSLETYNIYMRNRLMPHFGRPAQRHRPRAGLGLVRRGEREQALPGQPRFEILCAMIRSARQ